MYKAMSVIGGLGFLVGICSGDSNPVITVMILAVSTVMIIFGTIREEQYE